VSGPGESEPGPSGPSPWSYVGVGTEIAVPLLVGVLLGRWLDKRFGTEPWILIAGSLLGMAAGFLAFFRTVLPPRKGPGGRTK
jgi:F0F1-type ATP synthase assembly protein I